MALIRAAGMLPPGRGMSASWPLLRHSKQLEELHASELDLQRLQLFQAYLSREEIVQREGDGHVVSSPPLPDPLACS